MAASKHYFGDPDRYPNWFVKLDKAGQIPLETFWQRRAAYAGSYARSSFWKGMGFGAEGSMLGLPFIAMEAGMAQRGEVVPTLVARSAGLVTYPAISGVIAGGLALAFPQLKYVGFLASVVGMYPDSLVQEGLLHGLRLATDAARHLRHLEMGGTYQDSVLAQSQRMTALTEMSGAIGAGRRYLGQEAALMHR
jgi:hypothetical protein